jgi:hypothetical protein
MLTREPAGAVGRVTFRPGIHPDEACPTLENFALALAARQPLAWHGANGAWGVEWNCP